MTTLQAIILSVVEGITEFLPISSTGHLVLVSHILAILQTEFVKSFEIIIQLGAIAAVATQYGKTLIQGGRALLTRLVVAFIPTATIGLLLYPIIKKVFLSNPTITALALFVGGIFLIAYEAMRRAPSSEEEITNIQSLPLSSAFFIGIIQATSVIPGVSRAGATIVGGLLKGLSRETAVTFSFLLAVPTIAAASLLDIVKTPLTFTAQEMTILGIGLLGSFITALAVIHLFLRFVRTHSFISFGIYRIIIAILWLLIIGW